MTKRANIDEKGILIQGTQGTFWKLICEAIDKRLETLSDLEDDEEFAELPPDQYKLKSQLVKMEKRHLNTMKNYPSILIDRLEHLNIKYPDLDPYEKP